MTVRGDGGQVLGETLASGEGTWTMTWSSLGPTVLVTLRSGDGTAGAVSLSLGDPLPVRRGALEVTVFHRERDRLREEVIAKYVERGKALLKRGLLPVLHPWRRTIQYPLRTTNAGSDRCERFFRQWEEASCAENSVRGINVFPEGPRRDAARECYLEVSGVRWADPSEF